MNANTHGRAKYAELPGYNGNWDGTSFWRSLRDLEVDLIDANKKRCQSPILHGL
jgi:hypothetical protein